MSSGRQWNRSCRPLAPHPGRYGQLTDPQAQVLARCFDAHDLAPVLPLANYEAITPLATG
jgi:hypothetical protein